MFDCGGVALSEDKLNFWLGRDTSDLARIVGENEATLTNRVKSELR